MVLSPFEAHSPLSTSPRGYSEDICLKGHLARIQAEAGEEAQEHKFKLKHEMQALRFRRTRTSSCVNWN